MTRARRPEPPPFGARRRPWREAELASLDFETTGLDHERDAIVSFGVAPIRSGRVVVGDSIHQLVAPAVPASPTSMTIHGILPQDLAEAPPLEVARERLCAVLDRRFVVAWYAEVELAFLGRTFGGRRRAWVRRTIDVRRMAIRLQGDDPDVRVGLTSTAERYGVPVADPHDALDDAMVTAQLFLVLASKLGARGFGSVASFARLTART